MLKAGLAAIRLALAASVALAAPLKAQTLDDARLAFAMNRVDEAARIAAPFAAAGQAEALALMGLIARDAIPPDTQRARALLETAAAVGSATALVALGRAHQTGQLGYEADVARALEHFERAAGFGSEVAEVNVLALIASGALGEPDWPALHDRFAQLAQADAPGAAALWAEMLATGRGGLFNAEEARQVARDSDDPRAMRVFAWLLLQGVGGPADVPAGRAMLERAARAGNGAAATDLGIFHRDGRAGLSPDPRAAQVWFERAARAGDGWGATHLARLLSDGADTVLDDPDRAYHLYLAGDSHGVPAATHGLALAYWDGIATPVNTDMARTLMTRAAQAGFPRAWNDLGVMVETGVAGSPDPMRAAEHYEAAARGGDALGAWNLAHLLLDPVVAPTDATLGYAWCLWAEANAPDAATQAQYRADCEEAASWVPMEDREEGTALLEALPGPIPQTVAVP